MSIAWVWIENVWVSIFPRVLICDFSGRSAENIESVMDPRLPILVVVGWLFVAALQRSIQKASKDQPGALMGFVWAIVPFVLSSNLFFPVGTTRAERVLYLPSLGYCILVAHVLTAKPVSVNSATVRWCRRGAFAVTLLAFSYRCCTRAPDWNSSEALWGSAYATGLERGHVSAHTYQNYGTALSLCDRA